MNLPAIQWRHWRIDLIALAACVALTGGVHFGVISPMLARRAEQEVLRRHLGIARQRLEKIRQTRQKMREELASLQSYLRENPLRLEPVNLVNKRIATVTDLARDVDLDLQAIQPGEGESLRWCETVPLQVSVHGRFESCVRLLHRIGTDFPDTRIRSVQLAGTPSPTPSAARMSLLLTWYAAPAELSIAD